MNRRDSGETPDGGPDDRARLCTAHGDFVAGAYSQAITACGELGVSFELFRDRVWEAMADRLAKCASDGLSSKEVVEGLQLTDLYLAIAMASGDSRAWQAFSERFSSFVRSVAARMTRDRDVARQVTEEILGDLFFTDRAAGRSRIAGYMGASALERWLWLVLRNRITDVVRKRRRELSLEAIQELVAADAHASVAELVVRRADPEEQRTQRETREMLEPALEAAFLGLKARDKALLKMVFVDGASQRQAAALYEVHESRISRWLSGAMREVLSATVERLVQHHGLTPAEATRMAREAATETFGLEASRLLGGQDAPPASNG